MELSFDNVPEHLVIPFDAVKGFLDPAVQFGLQFETANPERRPREVEAAKPAARQGRGRSAAHRREEDAPKTPPQDEAAKVVSLDQFRKK